MTKSILFLYNIGVGGNMDKFTNLFRIEGQIALIYKDLSNVEANVTMDNIEDAYQLFVSLINKLLDLLEEEDKLLKSLSGDDVEIINYLLSNGEVKSSDGNNDMYAKAIKDRIDFRINGNNPILDSDKSATVLNYILDDFDNYYLSFIEEWIHNEKNKVTKEYLISKKYQCIFLLSRRMEIRKIKESFGTDESIYAESYIMSQISNFSLNDYIDYRDRVAMSKITVAINNLTSLLTKYNHNDNHNGQFKIIYKLFAYRLRAGLILLSNDVREEVIENILDEDDSFFDDISTFFDEDFNDMIKKDRERHKLLSLNI